MHLSLCVRLNNYNIQLMEVFLAMVAFAAKVDHSKELLKGDPAQAQVKYNAIEAV